MQTLAQLKSGKLRHIRQLRISENLTEFPVEIYELSNTLEILDLSDNQLSYLPADFGRLHQLKILFLSNNQFTQIPNVIADCINLDTISFKANRITSAQESVFPINTRWLILTDNLLEKLPNSIGQLPHLQKLMLAGNRLTELPATLANCTELQLLRISANQLSGLPDWLMNMPKLAWLAFAGNPFSEHSASPDTPVDKVALSDIQLHEQLGEGASGIIYRADWINQPINLQHPTKQIAVKLFKGHVTSDGFPLDELQACLTAGNHPNLVQLTAQLSDQDQLGLVMTLIPKSFFNLGLPPSMASCTRDTFAEGLQLSLSHISDIALGIANTLVHLHNQGVCHGDLYAHNILINPDAQVLLGDFGAASILLPLPELQTKTLKAFEVRAYGHLLDDLLMLCSDRNNDLALFDQLNVLKNNCTQVDTNLSPTFQEIKRQLNNMLSGETRKS